MREVKAAAALALLPWFAHGLQGALWVGPSSLTGPVQVPSGYEAAIAPITAERFGFDQEPPGANRERCDLGGFIPMTGPGGAGVIAQTGTVAGAQPASPPIALLITGLATETVWLDLELVEPVASVGFALMGLQSRAMLSIYDQDHHFVEDYVIPAGLAGSRRWVGMMEPGYHIGKVRIQPLGAGDYAIDDVELGISAPEPQTILLWIWLGAGVWLCCVRKSRRQSG